MVKSWGDETPDKHLNEGVLAGDKEEVKEGGSSTARPQKLQVMEMVLLILNITGWIT